MYSNGFFRKSVAFSFFLSTVFAQISPAFANVKTPGDEALSIYTRRLPAYEPNNFRAGDFIFAPALTTGITYDDNVYARNIDQVHDFIYRAQPSLNIQSDFVRHEITASFSAERGLYQDVKGEDYLDYNASVGGRFDITGQTSIPLNLSYARDHYRRGAPDDRGTSEPTKFNLLEAGTGLIHSGQTLALKVMAGLKKYVFDSQFNPLTLIDNKSRDFTDYNLYTSVGMAEDGYFAPFVYGNIRNLDYDQKFDTLGYQRDSFEYESGVGSIVNLSGVTKASFNVGYVHRTFDDPRFADLNAMTYGMNVIWEPSTLAAFKLEGKRTIGETTLENATSTVDSSLRLSMDYEMFVNLILTPSVSYRLSEYEGVDKKIETLGGGLDMTYKMNQNLWVTGSYTHTNQNESGNFGNLDEYNNNIVSLSLKMQF